MRYPEDFTGKFISTFDSIYFYLIRIFIIVDNENEVIEIVGFGKVSEAPPIRRSDGPDSSRVNKISRKKRPTSHPKLHENAGNNFSFTLVTKNGTIQRLFLIRA